ncbi:DUF1740-domain-containing protein [Sparassis latifolia]
MSAPSFSSFPPSFSSFPDLEAGTSKTTSIPKDRDQDDKRRGKKREGRDTKSKDRDTKDKKRKHERHYQKERDKEESRSRQHSKDREQVYGGFNDERLKAAEDSRELGRVDDAGSSGAMSPPLYFTDRKGDALNVRFGGLHAGDIPRYTIVDRGRTVLGLDRAWKVVHRGKSGVEIGIGGRRKMPALTDSSSRRLLAAPTRRLLSLSKDKDKYEEVEGFIRLPSGRKHKDDQSYRSITLQKHDAASDESGSSSSEAESSGDESDTTLLTSLQVTLKSLEEKLTSDPASVPTWLSLLSHTLSTIPLDSKNATKARSEITLSVLSRALSVHPSNATSRALRLRYIKAGEEVWHESELRAEWETAVKVGGIEIWLEWLDWRVRHTEKGIEGVVNDAKRVLGTLGSGEQDELGKLRVLWRVAVAFRDAGYVERASALFQAQAELTFKTPSSLASTLLETQLDALEEFWESESLRIGEAGAPGWSSWLASGRPDPDPHQLPRKSTDTRTADAEADAYRRWAALETLADRSQQLPTRTLNADDAAESDPFGTILFSDVRPLLVALRTPRAAHALRMVWLAFLGLHVPGFGAALGAAEDSTDDRWADAHLASQAYLNALIPAEGDMARLRITADAQAGVLVGREREYRTGFGPVKSWRWGVLGALEGIGEDAGAWRMWMREDVVSVDQGLVREVFRQCRRSGLEDVEWDVLALAFEAAVNAKGATKLSKALLGSAPDSLPLWAAHARLERLRGHTDDARKVYQAVLVSSHPHRPGDGSVWWDWAETEWLARKPDATLLVIVRSAGAEGTSGIAILRAKRQLDGLLGQVSGAQWKEREAWIKLRALLELLTASVPSALAVLDGHLGALEVGSAAHESLTVATLALLYYHGTVLRNPMPPVLLRQRTESAIETYPSNTVVLGMFLEAEKGQGIWGRVRAMLGESTVDGVSKEKDVARRVAEVWVSGWDKGRWEAEQERTRGGLSAAVQDDRTRGSAILWRLFVEFEIRVGQLAKAKKLLFRAVGECPLAKELYLLAFGPLRSEFSGRELSEWANTMAERGVRMRQGLDEMLEGWTEEREARVESGSEGEEEIETRARELRRLRPY